MCTIQREAEKSVGHQIMHGRVGKEGFAERKSKHLEQFLCCLAGVVVYCCT